MQCRQPAPVVRVQPLQQRVALQLLVDIPRPVEPLRPSSQRHQHTIDIEKDQRASDGVRDHVRNLLRRVHQVTVHDIAANLPPTDVLRNRCRALAVLERIIDTGKPYYTYTDAWDNDSAALMSNGSGDEYAIVFTAAGAFIRVFGHESAMSPYRNPDHELWPGFLDGLPDVMRSQVEEPAFSDGHGHFLATAVLWRLTSDDRWHAGDGITFPPPPGPYSTDIDGSGRLDILLDDIADSCAVF